MHARKAAPTGDEARRFAPPPNPPADADTESTEPTTGDDIDLATFARIWRVDGRILETRSIRV